MTRDVEDTELLRSELFSIEQLKRHAAVLAVQQKRRPRPGPDKLLPRLAQNERVLTEAYDVVTAAVAAGKRIEPVEEWLLDNFYLIEQQIGLARRHLPRGYSRQLPQLSEGSLAGFPRIYELALELISHQDGHVDGENATCFLTAYQTIENLQLGELWAFPIMLRLALLENLRRIGATIGQQRAARDAGILWAGRMLAAAEKEPKRLVELLAEFVKAEVPLTAPFMEEFAARLQPQDSSLAFIQAWMDQQLAEQGASATQLLQAAARTAAANQISIANSIGSLRFIGSMNWKDFVEELSVVERLLREDPAGAHARQDFTTRDRYRHVVERLARASERPETEVAHEAVALARDAEQRLGKGHRAAHVGYYLTDRGSAALERIVGAHLSWRLRTARTLRRFRLSLYLGSIALLTALAATPVISALGVSELADWRHLLLAVAGIIGTSALAVAMVNRLVTLIVPPCGLPRLDFSQGIPDEHTTIVVVPTLLTTPDDIDALIEALEIRYLGNRDPNLYFGLLTDFADSPSRSQPDDDALLARARAGIEELNRRYGDDRPCTFYLFHRPRLWNPHERLWMGYERKRGKLEQFNALLCEARSGQPGSGTAAFCEIVGNRALLGAIKYVITLDTDTQLPREAGHTLVGNMAHPLNRPLYDPAKGRIVEGYAILQPRVSISLTSAQRSWFTRLYAGEAGIDPYTREVSDVYQDVFSEGSFIGKGIYDVDAFRQAVDGRFPENLILSHDLLEGGYARSGLVNDVDLIEEHPVTYTTEASRRHRWIRGDWQVAGWLLPRVPGPLGADGKPTRRPNPLSALSRWKIFDNLRRSLVTPALLLLIAGAWLWSAQPAWYWVALAAGVFLLPALLDTVIEFTNKPDEREWPAHFMLSVRAAVRPVLIALLNLIFLPYDAWICLDAILRSGLRMLYTRRGLLLWHTSGYKRRNARRTLPDYFVEMWVAPVTAAALAVALSGIRPEEWPYWGPVLLVWCLSPAVAWRISRPPKVKAQVLGREQQAFLGALARRTWRYFADFVGPEDNWLPPDNFQTRPSPMIATRTSPTNIGMALLATQTAHDFAYISAGELLERLDRMFSSMEKLERYRGHFYNWYDTRNLQPLRPHYVSSVDSGNLAGALIALQVGLEELKDQPVLPPRVFRGLDDTLRVLETQLKSSGDEAAQHLSVLRARLDTALREGIGSFGGVTGALADIARAADELTASLSPDQSDKETLYWARALAGQARALRDDAFAVMPQPQTQPLGGAMPSLRDLVRQGADEAAPAAERRAAERVRLIDALIARCREFGAMDFEFLYDTSRGLLAIGYDAGERRRDPSCYDLLASEARLASFVLIAQEQLPQKHWFALGRLLTSQGRNVSLISWSGSMFEYLMPQLLMPSYEDTLLDHTFKASVARQIEYGRQRGVPWGVSESCYNITDVHQVYQYRAFGVPGLGFKRGLAEDIVIAPYATALALMVAPREACANLRTLVNQGFLGEYGLYEAIDYTPSRVPRGQKHAVVYTFMAHHQGMSLLSMAHALLDRPMQRRFMSDTLMRTTELLLHERVPKVGGTLHPHAPEVSAAARTPASETGAIMRVLTEPNTPMPEVHLLSNGRFHVVATHAGGGYSRWHDLTLNRWREDATCDAWGTFIYLRDADTGQYWSAAYQPTRRQPDHYEAIFLQGRAEYRRRDHAIDTHTEIAVSAEDDLEIRRVTLANLTSRERHVELTTYAEVVLAPLNADLAHRAFSNLFVQTEILADKRAILCTRRRRTPEEQPPWMFHMISAPGVVTGDTSYETDRSRFIGRGRGPDNPAALERLAPLGGSAGSVLDPVVAIRSTATLPADASVTVHVITGVAATREAVLAMIEKYCDRHFVDRAFGLASLHSQQLLRQIDISESDALLYGRLAASVIHANPARRASPSVIVRNRLGQSGLWRFGISGDLPIVLVRIGDQNRVDLVRQALKAHAYWRMNGLASDLVIFNEDFSGYRAVLHDAIMAFINAGPEAQWLDKRGGVFVRRAEELSEEDRVLFQTVARVVLVDSAESFAEQVRRRERIDRLPPVLEPVRQAGHERVQPLAPRERIFQNGLGGFTPDGREYVVTLEAGETTPAPWTNVIASPHIGTVVSESGGAYTWVDNAHEFRLTPFSNDPVSDTSGEAFYIRDDETTAFWSPSPWPARGRAGYVCRHGFGYSVFEHFENGIYSETTVYVAMDAPVKLAVVKLRNHSGRTRRLSLTGYWELVMGEWRHPNLMHIVTESDPNTGAVFARNAFARDWADRIVFAHVSEAARAVTGNRAEFIGRNGSLSNPAAMYRTRLSGKTGAALDPCAALQARIELADGQEREVVFTLGVARNDDEAQHFIRRFGAPGGAREALEAVWAHWNRTLGAVYVETPDRASDVLVNGWLVYQVLSSRYWGRSGYYQSGGAYGFRDQLQDTMALMHSAPWLAREQLLRCASRQFVQGDVQHWWHPPAGQGVRTHFSDDYLWLPYAACRYVRATGDTGVLDEIVPFLEGRPLMPEEEAYYDHPQRSTESASLYEHCVRAINYGLRFGPHGLPLMGCGDWNDGMNLVGRHGKGESVWLAWFLYHNLTLFAELAQGRADAAFADQCRREAVRLRESIESQAWDGEWYRRAYFDDGTPLGSAQNDECEIDSISQSWAVISGGGDPARAKQAMNALDQRLVQRDANLIKLLDPPFDKSALEPGYIKGYVPGVRENGGQYTHAAIWATMGFALMEERARAWELFGMLNPIRHGGAPEGIARYKVEPYVMAADVYAAPPHTGRGGWTWYTGAAGWMYRLAVETLLGIDLVVDRLHLSPRIPHAWVSYKIHYRYRETFYHITFRRVGSKAELVGRLTLDGAELPLTDGRATVPLTDDRRDHHVEVELTDAPADAEAPQPAQIETDAAPRRVGAVTRS